jgi:virginiamycin B lyase
VNQIGRISTTGKVTEYKIPTANSQPQFIAAGPDGALWFTEGGVDKIGRVTVTGTFSEYSLTQPGNLKGIAAGPDGAVWFAQACPPGVCSAGIGNNLGRITASAGATLYPTPTSGAQPFGIAAGPDGALWFTEIGTNDVGRMTTAGSAKEYPGASSYGDPWSITAGPDGAMWLTELCVPNCGGAIARITTSEAITEYRIGSPGSTAAPLGIAAGSDGALWFTDANGNSVDRITTAGKMTIFGIPTASSGPQYITAGPDGALWFAEFSGNRIGRLTTGGTFTEYPL